MQNSRKPRVPRPDLRPVLRRLLAAGLEWEDAEKSKDANERSLYGQQAKAILGSSIWMNEMRMLQDAAIRSAAAQAGTYDEIRDMRMVVAAMELIDERLQVIAAWATRDDPDDGDPNAPI